MARFRTGICQRRTISRVWSDARAYDGTVTILQPLIEPLYGGRTAHELVDLLLTKAERNLRDVVQEYWRTQPGTRISSRSGSARCMTAWFRTPPFRQGALRLFHLHQPAHRPGPARWRSSFGQTPLCGTGRFRTTHGCRRCPSPRTNDLGQRGVDFSPATAQQAGRRNEDVVEMTFRAGRCRGRSG